MALFKNKETDKKRKGENVIGKIIYGFLLFAPLMSILFTSLYTVFNKNAFESYYGETINEKQYEQVTNFVVGKTYDFILPTTNTFERKSNHTEMSVENVIYNGEVKNISALRVYVNSGQTVLTVQGIGVDSFIFNSTNNITLQFTYLGITNNNYLEDIKSISYIISYNKYSYLDNAFEYGMYKTEESNIYNWSKETGTYTVLQNVCTGIGITNTFVPMLMAYWLLISIIYFLFDIALILIWAVHDKIHALKDTI